MRLGRHPPCHQDTTPRKGGPAGTDRHNPLVLGGVIVTCAAVTALTGLRVARSGRTGVAPQRPAEEPALPASARQRVASVGGTPAGR